MPGFPSGFLSVASFEEAEILSITSQWPAEENGAKETLAGNLAGEVNLTQKEATTSPDDFALKDGTENVEVENFPLPRRSGSSRKTSDLHAFFSPSLTSLPPNKSRPSAEATDPASPPINQINDRPSTCTNTIKITAPPRPPKSNSRRIETMRLSGLFDLPDSPPISEQRSTSSYFGSLNSRLNCAGDGQTSASHQSGQTLSDLFVDRPSHISRDSNTQERKSHPSSGSPMDFDQSLSDGPQVLAQDEFHNRLVSALIYSQVKGPDRCKPHYDGKVYTEFDLAMLNQLPLPGSEEEKSYKVQLKYIFYPTACLPLGGVTSYGKKVQSLKRSNKRRQEDEIAGRLYGQKGDRGESKRSWTFDSPRASTDERGYDEWGQRVSSETTMQCGAQYIGARWI